MLARIFIFFLLLSSCAPPIAVHWDISSEPRVSYVIGKEYRLTQDVFVMRAYADRLNPPDFILRVPRDAQLSPISVECYETYGKAWQWHDEGQLYVYKSCGHFPIDADAVLDVIRAGTCLKIVSVEEKSSFWVGPYILVFCKVNDSRYFNQIFQMEGFFECDLSDEPGVIIDEKYLEPIN